MALSTASRVERPILLLAGAAAGLGASIANRFAHERDVVGMARSDRAAAAIAESVREGGGSYTHVVCDVAAADEVATALTPYLDRIDVVVHNVNALRIGAFSETSPGDFEQVWRATCLSAFVVAQMVLPHMVARQRGTIIVSGATAGIRGAANFAAFASAKFALRGLTQSLAREYGPRGIHLAYVVLDGLIDSAQTEKRFGPATSTRMDPDAIAEAYFNLAAQPRSAWTQALDLRPFSERF